ncbi:MAG: SpoIIE family protein phosphatase [Paludibacteraceae bacterium]|nr:SpoIIE family protein phosphatase [Paludibacteraceae bacterium]
MKKISASFQQWLLLIVGIAFIVTLVFLGQYQTKLFTNSANNLLKLYIKDVCHDIYSVSNKNLLTLTKAVATEVNNADLITSEQLTSMLEKYDVTEINYIATNSIIQASSNADFIGFDMGKGGVQSSEFLALLGAITEYIQPFQPIGYDPQIYRKYAGVSLAKGGFIQVGYNEEDYHRALKIAINEVVKNRHVGKSGFLIVTDSEWRIVSDRYNNKNQPVTIVTAMTKDLNTIDKEDMFEEGIYIDGTLQRCFCMHNEIEGYKVIAVYPYSEAMVSRNVSLKVMTVMQILIFGLLFVMIFRLVRQLVVKNIHQVNRALSAITEGKLETVVDVRSHEEFDALSNDINATVYTLKRYIKEAEERIDAELAFAKAIQHAALPSVFPPYPERKEFEIFASMHTAKEVGGDFYDFYFVDDENLAFLMADVSGKGIPAAMFMMTAKTFIKSFAESGLSVEQVFTHANAKLCEGNDAGMFVTAWLGILNTKTGQVQFANAGHNPPLVRHADGTYEYLKSRAGFVLAGMEGVRYRKNELTLAPGDAIYLYTDGVTEATNLNEELYGEERLQKVLDIYKDATPETICAEVKKDVDKFVGEAPQFDDITMLAIRYEGTEN